MMSELTRLHAEALRLLTVYLEYKDCNDEFMRRKVHLDLDRFLMEHREIAAVLMTQGLQDTIFGLVAEESNKKKAPWYKRLLGGEKHVISRNRNKEAIANSSGQ